jgi:signal transduction histidine kinase
MVDLAQDVMQKLALSAASRRQCLVPLRASGPVDVFADIGMIERVMTNLLDNAIHHTPSGGEIAVSLAVVGDHVRVGVADCGPGIPTQMRPLLFTHTTARSRDGGGLGLVIVRQILQMHGSDITLCDGANGGCEFVFLLPTRN